MDSENLIETETPKETNGEERLQNMCQNETDRF